MAGLASLRCSSRAFCEQPLLAEHCRVYIYNVALRLGVPIKGAAGLRDGIEIFPRQDRLAPGEFGNALRGPLGVHRANNHRYWFYDAGSDITSQLAYLKNLKKLSEAELTRLSLGMTIPDEFLRKPTTIELPPCNPDPNRKQFSILDFVQKPRRKASGDLCLAKILSGSKINSLHTFLSCDFCYD